MKIFLKFILVCFLLNHYTYRAFAQDTMNTINGKKDYLRNIAFCDCLYYSFHAVKMDLEQKDNSIFNAADLTSASLNDFKKIEQMAIRFAKRIQPSPSSQDVSRKPIIMRCLDFYNSDSLQILLKKIKVTPDN